MNMPRSYSQMTPAERAFVDEERAVAKALFADDEKINEYIDAHETPGGMAGLVASLESCATVVRKYVPALLERVSELERRLSEVEKGGIRYRGVWQRADEYKRGDSVTCDGSLWIKLSDNPTAKPGNGPDWQLAIPELQRR